MVTMKLCLFVMEIIRQVFVVIFMCAVIITFFIFLLLIYDYSEIFYFCLDLIQDKYSCHYDGLFYENQQTWRAGQCTVCTCEGRVVKCKEEACDDLSCEVKRIQKDECCPVCTGECESLDHDRYFSNGESWTEKDDCTHCTCKNGQKYCYSESCTPLTCSNPIKNNGSCCHHCQNEGLINFLSFFISSILYLFYRHFKNKISTTLFDQFPM